MYLKCPVTFQENTCILTFCMYFTRIPNESKIHFGIHIRYIRIHVSWALPWCHTGYMSGYIKIRGILDSSSRYIRIHRDTKLRYMYLERVMTTLQDTIKIHHDTCILDASSEPRWIHTRYARDTQQIHQGYVSWARSICLAVQGAQGAPPLRRSSRAPLGARVEGLAPVPFDCSP
jgi:hypothetical protein